MDPARLKDVELFSPLDDAERAHLATWLEVEEYPAGKAIVRDEAAQFAPAA